jgi:hypothetical protein
MGAYAAEKINVHSATKNPNHSARRLYRRTNKIDATEFSLKKLSNNTHNGRHQYNTEQALDEWLTQIFTQLYNKNRFDTQKFSTQIELIWEGLRLGAMFKKMYFALEKLLTEAKISEDEINSKDLRIFALYQILRSLEHQFYQKQHIYTSELGKRNSEMIIAQLNQLIPGWLDQSGKISKTLKNCL